MKTRTTRPTLLATAILASCALGAENGTNPNLEVIEIRQIDIDPQTGFVTLRWNSQFESTYAIEETTNLQFGWKESIPEISGDQLETTYTLLPQLSNIGAKAMFFRIRKLEESENNESDVQTAATDEADSIETSKSQTQIADAEKKEQVDRTSKSSTSSFKLIDPTQIPKRGIF